MPRAGACIYVDDVRARHAPPAHQSRIVGTAPRRSAAALKAALQLEGARVLEKLPANNRRTPTHVAAHGSDDAFVLHRAASYGSRTSSVCVLARAGRERRSRRQHPSHQILQQAAASSSPLPAARVCAAAGGGTAVGAADCQKRC